MQFNCSSTLCARRRLPQIRVFLFHIPEHNRELEMLPFDIDVFQRVVDGGSCLFLEVRDQLGDRNGLSGRNAFDNDASQGRK